MHSNERQKLFLSEARCRFAYTRDSSRRPFGISRLAAGRPPPGSGSFQVIAHFRKSFWSRRTSYRDRSTQLWWRRLVTIRRSPSSGFRPARGVISWAYYWIKFQSEAQNVLLLPRRQPATYDISQSVNDTIKEYNGRGWAQIMRPNVEELKRLVVALERRGCHIVLFELPSAPGVRETEYVKAAHILAKESFPGAEKWLAISDDRSELRWVDASHMDERSAIIVAQQIDRFLALVAR